MLASTYKIKNLNLPITFCVGIFLSFNIMAQTTPIPDTNFEQTLIDYNIDTNGLNGNILNSDAESVTTLNIFSKNITDLTGIEAFVNLRNLYCYFNNLESLDLHANLDLEVLDIENNSITSIDISVNTNLKEIYIGNNLLSTLDVSNNVNLEVLSCSLNDLTTLNVNNNELLTVLWCYSNDLNTVNLENNLLLQSLFIGDNNLHNLNVDNNPLLESISCGQNSLNTLSISNSFDLTYLDVSGNDLITLNISSNSNLKRLLCTNNELENLDVSMQSDLILLYASNNSLRDIDLSENQDLRFVLLNNNELSSIDIRNNQNSNISDFNATSNPNLTCIFVDDSEASFLQDWDIDPITTFVETETECNSLSRDMVQALEFSMYPNPANNYVNLTITQPKALIRLFTINGQLVKEQPLSFGLNNIDTSQLSSGMYVMKLSSDSQTIAKKLIIE